MTLKFNDIQNEMMKNNIIEQLRKYPRKENDKPIEEMTLRELKVDLAVKRTVNVDVESSENRWF